MTSKANYVVQELVAYAISHSLIEEEDTAWATAGLMKLLALDDLEQVILTGKDLYHGKALD